MQTYHTQIQNNGCGHKRTAVDCVWQSLTRLTGTFNAVSSTLACEFECAHRHFSYRPHPQCVTCHVMVTRTLSSAVMLSSFHEACSAAYALSSSSAIFNALLTQQRLSISGHAYLSHTTGACVHAYGLSMAAPQGSGIEALSQRPRVGSHARLFVLFAGGVDRRHCP